jgi:anti-sigma factor RsiW
VSEHLTCEEVREFAAPFVLGALDADETEAVLAHLGECPEAHDEFAELGSVVPALAESLEPVEPPAALKGRILDAAAAELASRRPMAAPAAAASAELAAMPAPTPLLPRRRFVEWALAVAAVLAIVALVGSNLLLLGRLDAKDAYARDVAAVLEAASEPGALTAVLAPAEAGGPRGLAAVGPDGRLTLAMQDLAPTSGDQVYEGWVIVGDAPPAPLGGFRVGDAGTGRLDGTGLPIQPGMALALTLEPGPGAQSPTLPILAVGTAVAATGAAAGERPQAVLATLLR